MGFRPDDEIGGDEQDEGGGKAKGQNGGEDGPSPAGGGVCGRRQMKGEKGGEDSGKGAEKSAGAGEFQFGVTGGANEVIRTRKDLEDGEFDEAERTGTVGHGLIHRKCLSGQFYTFVGSFERDRGEDYWPT